DEDGAGVLGLAINKSSKFTPNPNLQDGNEDLDLLKSERFDSQPPTSTSIPEPTTTLASIFALGFAGKFLRKTKKNNA
ncbi:MAG: hypothetical protein AAFQ91_34010, partial [Cyanobacteria bacterium J06621_15]